MILNYCKEHHASLTTEWSHDALDDIDSALERVAPPLGLSASQVLAVLNSSLFEAFQDEGRTLREAVSEKLEIPALDAIETPGPAEYARLISKGRILYEHCMTEVSHACVVGFMAYEMKKSRGAARVIYDLVGWMVEQHIDVKALEEDEGDEAVCRLAHSEYMIDQGVALLHGLPKEAAAELGDLKQPI